MNAHVKPDSVKSNEVTTDPGRAQDFLDPSEIARFLDAAKSGRNPVRDHLLFLMMYRHGLRCSEAADLRIEDISLDRATVWIRRLKGSNSGCTRSQGTSSERSGAASAPEQMPYRGCSSRNVAAS